MSRQENSEFDAVLPSSDTPAWPDGSGDLPPVEPWDVTCARCGHKVSTNDATPEEGDEWECLPCNNAWNKIERLERKLSRYQEALEEIGGYDCRESCKYLRQEPCGKCLSCLARAALSEAEESHE